MDKFTIPPGYPGKCTPDKLKKLADKLKDSPGFRERLLGAGTRKNQRNVISNLLGAGTHTTNPSDREQLRRHFLLYFGLTNPPGELDQCREDRTLMFMVDPPRWADTPQAKKVVINKAPKAPIDITVQEMRNQLMREVLSGIAATTPACGGSVTSAAPSIAKQVTFADIERFSKYMDEVASIPKRDWFLLDTPLARAEFGHLDGVRFINASPSHQNLPKKETTVNTKPLTITTKTFTYVNGVDVNNYSANELYDMIAREESKIRALEAIDNKPVMLQQEIARRKDGIAALVAHLDSITVVPSAKPVDPTTEAQINDAPGV